MVVAWPAPARESLSSLRFGADRAEPDLEGSLPRPPPLPTFIGSPVRSAERQRLPESRAGTGLSRPLWKLNSGTSSAVLGELPGLLLLGLVTLRTTLVPESEVSSGLFSCEKGSSARGTRRPFAVVSSGKQVPDASRSPQISGV